MRVDVQSFGRAKRYWIDLYRHFPADPSAKCLYSLVNSAAEEQGTFLTWWYAPAAAEDFEMVICRTSRGRRRHTFDHVICSTSRRRRQHTFVLLICRISSRRSQLFGMVP